MTHIILPRDLISAYTVADTEGSLMRQPACPHCCAVQSARHHDKAAVAALGCPVAEGLVKIKQFIKLRSAHDVHDAVVIDRSVGVKPVGSLFFELMGQIAAGDKYHAPAQTLRGLADLESQSVMIRQRQT